MKNLDELTTFENGERNGWENDAGSLDGILVTEGQNTFWSGRLECPPTHRFMPSIAKMFTLPGGDQDRGILLVRFMYRVHPPEPGEATSLAIVVTSNISLASSSIAIDSNTKVDKWLAAGAGVSYISNRTHIVFGTDRGVGSGVSRKIDIDDIRVLQIPNS